MISVQAHWEAVFDRLGIDGAEIAPLPNIKELLNGKCPVWPGKKIWQTHALVPLPKQLKSLRHLALCIEEHNKKFPADRDRIPSDYSIDVEPIGRGILDEPYQRTRWVLFLKEGLPKGLGESFENLSKRVDALSRKALVEYEVPQLKDIYAVLMLHYASTRERLYCLEKIYAREMQTKRVVKWCCFSGEVESPLVVGPFGRGSLPIENVLAVSVYRSYSTMAAIRTV
ncbi:MAG: hypothetical protein COT85_05565 [Chlamydiae bacterium CG10_big_fil_rev_8_21_14_0_10_42_34]|nr:MAG: hypothetical protein COT85_05565 [Chlamydiae bacterium CG10_big_fil_rev_8_21_14_0_10_42_34]